MTASGVRLPCQNVGENNHFTIFEQGCLNVTKEYVKSHAIIFGTAGIIVACLMVIISCSLFVYLRRRFSDLKVNKYKIFAFA